MLCRYHEYRIQQEKLHQEWLEEKKAHDEAVARGEKVKALRRDPTEVQEVGVLGVLKFLLVLAVVVSLSGKFVTNSYTWDYETKWLQLKSYIPVSCEYYHCVVRAVWGVE